MGKVRLEFLGWVAETVDIDSPPHELALEHPIDEGQTVCQVLNQFAVEHSRFGKLVFDVKGQKLSEDVFIFVNEFNTVLADGLRTRLKDGDVLTLAPMMEGG
ncbi:MAG: MoaD/ThiS family protein [Desulfobacterales bacterium]|nr:MoaD/ThiS family protein [Desulfobacterales bacterium]